MKRIAIGFVTGAIAATNASAEGVVEIIHKSLRPGLPVVAYWCIKKDQIPAEYSEPGLYVLADRDTDKREGGLLIASQPDTMVFLTSETCLDETLSSYSSYGGSVEDLTFTRK